jgi:hypothetical protein
MRAAAKHPFKYLSIAFLCIGVTFVALALSDAEQRLTYGLIALTNLCVGIVFFSRSRAAQQEDGQQ